MDLNKILAREAQSPPHTSRIAGPQRSSTFMMARNPGPSEFEAAEFMMALAASPPAVYHKHDIDTSDFISHRHPSPSLFTGSPSNSPTMEAKGKGKRGNVNTKKLVPSPSGQPCPNCSVETSTLWRTCEMENGASYLCNACGLRYKKGKFCPLCYRVYYDADTNQVNWKQCQHCLNWTHKACLHSRGWNVNSGSYSCPNCRRKTDLEKERLD